MKRINGDSSGCTKGTTIQVGGLTENVGLSVTLTLMASSTDSLRLKLVTMQIARRPCEPGLVVGPSRTASSMAMRLRKASRMATKSASTVS